MRYLTFMLLFAALPANAEDSVARLTNEAVTRHMTEKNIPGLSVAIVHQGETIHTDAFGSASIELGIPATETTVYPISSVSKMFAGLLAMRLVEAGLLDLDASIAEFIDDVPEDKRAITVRHLLQLNQLQQLLHQSFLQLLKALYFT